MFTYSSSSTLKQHILTAQDCVTDIAAINGYFALKGSAGVLAKPGG
jgi:hypothetical protein